VRIVTVVGLAVSDARLTNRAAAGADNVSRRVATDSVHVPDHADKPPQLSGAPTVCGG
jgi:hypothetical protein